MKTVLSDLWKRDCIYWFERDADGHVWEYEGCGPIFGPLLSFGGCGLFIVTLRLIYLIGCP